MPSVPQDIRGAIWLAIVKLFLSNLILPSPVPHHQRTAVAYEDFSSVKSECHKFQPFSLSHLSLAFSLAGATFFLKML